MKNNNLPIIQALKAKMRPKGEPTIHDFQSPRTFEIQHHEIPGLVNKKVGDPVTVSLTGQINSQHSDGKAIMHVASVKQSGDSPKADNPPVSVRTQESHAP